MTEQNRLRRGAWRIARSLASSSAPIAAFSLSAAVLVALPAIAQEAPALSLQDAIAGALGADPGLRAADAGVDAALGARVQARARPNPQLDVEVENFNGQGELRGFDGAETTFSLSQEVDLTGQRRARIRLADRELHGAELERLVRGLDLARDVQLAYYAALAAEEMVTIARERLATAEALNSSVARRVAAARDPLMAGARAEAGVAEARIALRRAESESATARAHLASLIGAEGGIALVSADFALPEALSHEHVSPSDDSPDMARLLTARDRAGETTRVERSLSWRNPTLSVGYRRFEADDGEGALVAGVSIPLGVFDRNQGNVARARAERRRAEYELEAGRRTLQREYAALQRAMQTDAEAVRATEESVIPQAQRALALAQDGYNRGAFSYLDVLDAQRALTDAREGRVEALRSFHTNEAALDRLTARFAEIIPDEEIH